MGIGLEIRAFEIDIETFNGHLIQSLYASSPKDVINFLNQLPCRFWLSRWGGLGMTEAEIVAEQIGIINCR